MDTTFELREVKEETSSFPEDIPQSSRCTGKGIRELLDWE